MDVKLGSSAGLCANRRCIGGIGRPHFGHDGFRTKSRSVVREPIREDLADRVRENTQAFIFTDFRSWSRHKWLVVQVRNRQNIRSVIGVFCAVLDYPS